MSSQNWKELEGYTQVGSLAVRLRLASARLGLNDGAKLWISFKIFSKQISSYRASSRIICSFKSDGVVTKFMAKYELY